MSHTYEYPRPAVTVDCVVFGLDEDVLKVLLIQRRREPFQHCWALPGGFLDMDESLEEAAMRELREETGIEHVYLEQLYTFGHPERDPRGRVITVAYYALAKLSDHPIAAASDAENVAWFRLDELPELAFDHESILIRAQARLRAKVRYEPIGFELLPAKFSLSQLQRLYEIVLEEEIDKRNFRRKFLSMGLLIETDEVVEDVAHRKPRLYRFDRDKYDELAQNGFEFAI